VKRNAVEWAVLLVSLGGIVVLVGVLIVEGLRGPVPADPRIELLPGEARQAALGWILPATLANGGEEAVEGVVVEATATISGEEEVSELEVAFLPAGTEVDIAFAFSAEPEGEITVRLVGFRRP
jgi:uncharacterized protein (TIGR02588 family)